MVIVWQREGPEKRAEWNLYTAACEADKVLDDCNHATWHNGPVRHRWPSGRTWLYTCMMSWMELVPASCLWCNWHEELPLDQPSMQPKSFQDILGMFHFHLFLWIHCQRSPQYRASTDHWGRLCANARREHPFAKAAWFKWHRLPSW